MTASLDTAEKVSVEDLPLIGQRYHLRLVKSLRQDDIRAFLGNAPGAYICNCPEQGWYDAFKLVRKFNYSVEKKKRMFSRMAPRSIWISPTGEETVWGPTTDVAIGSIQHLGNRGLRGKTGQVYQTLRMSKWLFAHRAEYEYCLVYNLYPIQFMAALFAKLALAKRLVVDYEDDETLLKASRLRKVVVWGMQRLVDGAICIHSEMESQFPKAKTCVSNSFADLGYARDLRPSLREGMSFLYSGRLDDVRGADLIPDLVRSLRTRLSGFKIRVTGDGPLRPMIESLNMEEVEYLGFLPAERFRETVASTDACLILQKPDHPFSRGSFPSKIEAYAEHRKPIFLLAVGP